MSLTPKEEAERLVELYIEITPVDYSLNDTAIEVNEKALKDLQLAKQCALIDVRNTIAALEDYGKRTMELQNMDREFAWWDEVYAEIKKL